MLTVKNNYLYRNNDIFFYQGDTAWLLFEKLSLEDIILYLNNRKSLGFNVIQATIIHTKKYINSDSLAIISYFNKIKAAIDYAKKIDMYFALLPCWGSILKLDIINEENAFKYADFLGKEFSSFNNIIWVLGGDIRGDYKPKVYNTMALTLKKYNSNRLMTFHPFGRTASYLWFNDEPWLDFNMFQSGHRRYDQLTLGQWDDNNANEDSFGEDNYKYVIKAKSYKNIKPILDGEPSYEGIVQGLHDQSQPYWEARHIRRYAYWSVLEGACGFCYGNSAVMQFHHFNDLDANYNVREEWTTAIHAPGGAQIQYLKELFIKYKFNNLKPENLVINNGIQHNRISCIADENHIICYSYLGNNITLNLSNYKNKKMNAYWMNPENNSKSFINTIYNCSEYTFIPTKRYELSNDWVLILEEENKYE